MGLAGQAEDMLRRAGLRVADLPEADVCCGFGGSTSLDHPEVARWIVDRKLANALATGAQLLVSDNPGCILHLRGAAHAAHAPFEVGHFVEPLADRLRQLVQVRKGE
jgi:Fe-S oxidoreductase